MNPEATPRINIDDLPEMETLTEEEAKLLYGAGRARLEIDHLETRSLMAANLTASFAGGVLHVEGTPGSDKIHILERDGKLSVEGIQIHSDGALFESVDAGATRIVIDALAGNDAIWLDAASQFLSPVEISVGEGQDFVRSVDEVFRTGSDTGVPEFLQFAGSTYQVTTEGAILKNGTPFTFGGVSLTGASLHVAETGLTVEGDANLVIGAVRVSGVMRPTGEYLLQSSPLHGVQSADGVHRFNALSLTLTPHGAQISGQAELTKADGSIERITITDLNNGSKEVYRDNQLVSREVWRTQTSGAMLLIKSEFSQGTLVAQTTYVGGIATTVERWSVAGYEVSTLQNGQEVTRVTYAGQGQGKLKVETWSGAEYRRYLYTNGVATTTEIYAKDSSNVYALTSKSELSGSKTTVTKFVNGVAVERIASQPGAATTRETWNTADGVTTYASMQYDASGNLTSASTYKNGSLSERLTQAWSGATRTMQRIERFSAGNKYDMTETGPSGTWVVTGTWSKNSKQEIDVTESLATFSTGTKTTEYHYQNGFLTRTVVNTFATRTVRVPITRVIQGVSRTIYENRTERYISTQEITTYTVANGQPAPSRYTYSQVNSVFALKQTKVGTWNHQTGNYNLSEYRLEGVEKVRDTTIYKAGNFVVTTWDKANRTVSYYNSNRQLTATESYVNNVLVRKAESNNGVLVRTTEWKSVTEETDKNYYETKVQETVIEYNSSKVMTSRTIRWGGTLVSVEKWSSTEYTKTSYHSSGYNIRREKSGLIFTEAYDSKGKLLLRNTFGSNNYISKIEKWESDGRAVTSEYSNGTLTLRVTIGGANGVKVVERWNYEGFPYAKWLYVSQSNFSNQVVWQLVYQEWWTSTGEFKSKTPPPSFSLNVPNPIPYLKEAESTGKAIATKVTQTFSDPVKKLFDQSWKSLTGTVKVPTWIANDLGKNITPLPNSSKVASVGAAIKAPDTLINTLKSVQTPPVGIPSTAPTVSTLQAALPKAPAIKPFAVPTLPSAAKVVGQVGSIATQVFSIPTTAALDAYQSVAKALVPVVDITQAAISQIGSTAVDFANAFADSAQDLGEGLSDAGKELGDNISDGWQNSQEATESAATTFAESAKEFGGKIAEFAKSVKDVAIPSQLSDALEAFGTHADDLAKLPLTTAQEFLNGLNALKEIDWTQMMLEGAENVGIPGNDLLSSVDTDFILEQMQDAALSQVKSLVDANPVIKNTGNTWTVSAKTSVFEFTFTFTVESPLSPTVKYWNVDATYMNGPLKLQYKDASDAPGEMSVKYDVGVVVAGATLNLSSADRVTTNFAVHLNSGAANGGTTLSASGTVMLNDFSYVSKSLTFQGMGNLIKSLGSELPAEWKGDAEVSATYDDQTNAWNVTVKTSAEVEGRKVVAKGSASEDSLLGSLESEDITTAEEGLDTLESMVSSDE